MLRFSANRLSNILYDIKCSLLNVRKLKLGRESSTQFSLRLELFLIWFTRFRPTNLRAVAGDTSHIKIFFNSLHTVCSMYGLSIYEIKRICHRARFFIISHGSFQHFANFLKKNNNKKQTNKRCPDY